MATELFPRKAARRHCAEAMAALDNIELGEELTTKYAIEHCYEAIAQLTGMTVGHTRVEGLLEDGKYKFSYEHNERIPRVRPPDMEPEAG